MIDKTILRNNNSLVEALCQIGLVDSRNLSLLQVIEKDYTVKVEVANQTQGYGIYSINDTSTIYFSESNISADAFTHELLHVYLRSKGIYIGARLKRKMQISKKLSTIYTEPLLEHIGNCLDHIKMLPIYLELGFDRSQFIRDYEKKKCTTQEVEQIKKHWQPVPIYNAQAVEFFLVKYFAVKACRNPDFEYDNILQELQQLDASLFSIQEKLISRWSSMKIDGRTDSDDDYIIIAEDYIAEMEGWAKSKIIA